MPSSERLHAPDGTLAPRVLILGVGYCGTALRDRLPSVAIGAPPGWRVGATLPAPAPPFDVVWLVPPTRPDEVRETLTDLVQQGARRAVYVSSTSVYGAVNGVADVSTPRSPTSDRGRARAGEEDVFLEAGGAVVRLPGIYGPGRSIFNRLGPAYRLVDGGTKWSARIHRDDVAMALEVLLRHGGNQPYLLCDDEPFQVRDLVAHACGLANLPLPPTETLPEYAARRGEFAASFWRHSNHYDPSAIASLPGFALKYKSWRDGLAAIHRDAQPGS
jgi:nucleoside-diphosphate-sugar epimerase